MTPQFQYRPPIASRLVDLRRVQPPDLGRPVLPFSRAGLEFLRQMRRNESERDPRRHRIALAITALINVLILIGLILSLRMKVPEYETLRGPRSAVEVQIIEQLPEVAPPPEPVPPEFHPRPTHIKIAPPVARITPPPKMPAQPEHEMNARIGSEGAPAPIVLNPDGSVRLPKPVAPIAPVNPVEAGKARWAEIAHRGDNPLDCHRTRFAAAYAPDESLGDKVARKYLGFVGLADPQVLAHHHAQRESRAAAGCPPL